MQDTTTSGFDAALKTVYSGPIREQLNDHTNLLDLFTKGSIEQYKWEGRNVVYTLHKSRNSGVKSTGEGGVLPAAGKQGYANLTIPMKFTYGRIELTAQVIKASRTDKGAFARAMDEEQKRLVNDLSRQRNRQIASYGSGTLATIATGANSATQALSAPGGVAGTTNVTRFVKPGAVIAVTDATGATLRGVQTVLSVSEPNIVLDAALNTTTGDLVSLGTNAVSPGESSYNSEPMGLLGLVDSTTYVSSIFGLDRSLSANQFFRSNVLGSVGVLSADLLQRAIDNAEEVSGELIDQFLAHASVRREVIKLTEADRRYAAGASAMNFDAGSKANKKDLTHNDIPIKVDKDFAYGTLMGLKKDSLFWIPEVEGEWADEDGSILLRAKDKDNYEGRYRIFENFMSDRGNVNLRLDGITATVSSGVFSD